MTFARTKRSIALVAVFHLAALAGCGTKPAEHPDETGDPVLGMIDGKVCGYFDQELLKSLFVDEPLASTGDGIRAASGDASQGAADQCEVFGARSDDTYVLARMSESKTAVYDPSAENRTKPGPGCVARPDLTGWDGFEVCASDRNVQVSAVSTERLVRLTVFTDGLKDGHKEGVAAEAAVELVQNLNVNAGRYHELHAG